MWFLPFCPLSGGAKARAAASSIIIWIGARGGNAAVRYRNIIQHFCGYVKRRKEKSAIFLSRLGGAGNSGTNFKRSK